jgi:DNA-binding transcriptional regulator LsrR (DeoR family)
MMISRYLRKCREEGIVNIHINYENTFVDLEWAIKKQFGLEEVVVVPCEDGPRMKRILAQEAAGVLLRRLRGGDVVGVGWGSTLALMPEMMKGSSRVDAVFVPLLGGCGQVSIHMHANQIASRLGESLGCKSYILNAPALVSSVELKEGLLNDNEIKPTLDMARRADVALVGVGAPFEENSTLTMSGYYSPDDLEALRAAKIACNLLSTIYIDQDGNERDLGIAQRNVGITAEEYKNIPLKIAVAGGAGKSAAVYWALRHKLADVIVTDNRTAEFCAAAM